MNITDIKSTKTSKSITEKATELKETILKNANALADRILNKAIAIEEREKLWSKKKDELVAKATELRKKAAQAKRERKNTVRLKVNKTIPFHHCGNFATTEDRERYEVYMNTITKRQAELSKQREEYFVKLQVADEVKQLAKEKAKAKAKEEKPARRKPTDRTTKEQRIEACKQAKIAGKRAYKEELKKQASEIEADPKGYAKRQQKKQEDEQKRLDMLAEKRKARMEKQQIQIVSTAKRIADQIKAFKKAQEIRLKKKNLKRSMYLTKGGISTPKVKNTVSVDTQRAQEYIENAAKKTPKIIGAERYIIETTFMKNGEERVNVTVTSYTCTEKDLHTYIKNIHNSNRNNANYIKVCAKLGFGDNQRVVYEMINKRLVTEKAA